jgi:hypothetical protein
MPPEDRIRNALDKFTAAHKMNDNPGLVYWAGVLTVATANLISRKLFETSQHIRIKETLNEQREKTTEGSGDAH